MPSTIALPFQPDAMTPGPTGGGLLPGSVHRADPQAVRLPAALLVRLVRDQQIGPAGRSAAGPPRALHPPPHDDGLRYSSINTMLHAVRGFFRFAHIDGLIAADPAVDARLPKIHADETRTQGLDRLELICFLHVAQTLTVHHGALAFLLGINALRASEAARPDRGLRRHAARAPGPAPGRQRQQARHHAPHAAGAPGPRGLPRATHRRSADPAAHLGKAGQPTRRLPHGAADKVAGIPRHISPHSLRHAAITNAHDAGVPLRDAQILARHADPRTTQHYDRARGNLDRHGVHFLTAYVTGV